MDENVTPVINLPELPPGYIRDTSERSLGSYIRIVTEYVDEDGFHISVMLVYEIDAEGKCHLCMGAPEVNRWTFTSVYDNVQDAVDAGVARLWLGAWT